MTIMHHLQRSCPLTLAELADPVAVEPLLADHGLRNEAAASKAKLLAAAAGALQRVVRSPGAPSYAFWVPGRIEVLGKHTDYAGGRSVVTATEQGFCLVAVPRDDAMVHLRVEDGQEILFPLDPDLTPRSGHWSNYPMTVGRRLARNFSGPLRGVDLALASDLPVAAGMSSSSAFMVGVALALLGANQLYAREELGANIETLAQLAEYLGTVENGQSYGSLTGDRGVGTFGGSEDHTAILCAEATALRQFAYCPTRFERSVPLPVGTTLVVADSGVVAEKTGNARELYNRASHLAGAVVAAWQRATGHQDAHMAAMLARTGGDPDPIRAVLVDAENRDYAGRQLLERFNHFYLEDHEIIPTAMDALARRDLDAFGRLVDHSQDQGATLLGNQVPETMALADLARESGAWAASAFGAGFGGSVWALAPTDGVEAFVTAWRTGYHAAFPHLRNRCRFLHTGAGPAALALGREPVSRI